MLDREKVAQPMRGASRSKDTAKPKCKLSGTNGNVFALGGKVKQCLERAGQPEKAEEFAHRLFKCKSYGEAIALMADYVEAS